MKGQRFPLGRCQFSSEVLEALARSGERLDTYLGRHARGDWGLAPIWDQCINDRSILSGERILSRYKTTKGDALWIFTEGDRSKTSVFLVKPR